MLGEPARDWKADRRAAAVCTIVQAAWELARKQGLAGFSLRDLARRVGMAAPSLYSYFPSKNALYDAMYEDGWRTYLQGHTTTEHTPASLRDAVRTAMKDWIDFAVADPVRNQLLNQRTVPGFEPSSESYALAQEAYVSSFAPVEALVSLNQEDRDLLTALVAGLLNQQFANDPGGTRWIRLLDDAVDLLMPRFERRTS